MAGLVRFLKMVSPLVSDGLVYRSGLICPRGLCSSVCGAAGGLFVGPEFVGAVADAGPAFTVRALLEFVFVVVGVVGHQNGPFLGWVHLATVPLATLM